MSRNYKQFRHVLEAQRRNGKTEYLVHAVDLNGEIIHTSDNAVATRCASSNF